MCGNWRNIQWLLPHSIASTSVYMFTITRHFTLHFFVWTHLWTYPHTLTVLPSTGSASTCQGWPMGTGQFSLQNWNQTGRRELWPGVQRYTLCGGFYNTSQDVHSKADSKWETAIHCCSETSERCAQYTECFKTHRLTARIYFCLPFWCKALECPPPTPPRI